MSRIEREIAPSRVENYARHILTGNVIHFRGYWKPLQPHLWASWHPVAGVPEMHLIGEPELFYRLRQWIAQGNVEAVGLLTALRRYDVDSDEWQAAYKAGCKLTSLAHGKKDEEP